VEFVQIMEDHEYKYTSLFNHHDSSPRSSYSSCNKTLSSNSSSSIVINTLLSFESPLWTVARFLDVFVKYCRGT
jgi:hypothetical protein